MPGKLDSTQGASSFISNWFKHRSAVAASDNTATPAATPALDLSRSPRGIDTQIWVYPVRTAGAGTVDILLYAENNGSLVAVDTHRQIASKTALDNKTIWKFTDLEAGKYYVLLANVAGGATWDVHVAVNCRV